MRTGISRRRNCAIAVAVFGCVFTAGCNSYKFARIQLVEPRVILHVEGDPKELIPSLRSDGLTAVIHQPPGKGGGGDVVLEGSGTLWVGSSKIAVKRSSVVIGGVTIESAKSGYRNVLVKKDGTVKPDSFAPFE